MYNAFLFMKQVGTKHVFVKPFTLDYIFINFYLHFFNKHIFLVAYYKCLNISKYIKNKHRLAVKLFKEYRHIILYHINSAFILLNLLHFYINRYGEVSGPLSSLSDRAEPSLVKSQLRFAGFDSKGGLLPSIES